MFFVVVLSHLYKKKKSYTFTFSWVEYQLLFWNFPLNRTFFPGTILGYQFKRAISIGFVPQQKLLECGVDLTSWDVQRNLCISQKTPLVRGRVWQYLSFFVSTLWRPLSCYAWSALQGFHGFCLPYSNPPGVSSTVAYGGWFVLACGYGFIRELNLQMFYLTPGVLLSPIKCWHSSCSSVLPGYHQPHMPNSRLRMLGMVWCLLETGGGDICLTDILKSLPCHITLLIVKSYFPVQVVSEWENWLSDCYWNPN